MAAPSITGRLIDSHCHLDHYDEAERDGIVSRAAAAGLGGLVTISTHLARTGALRDIVAAHDRPDFRVWRTVGIHPCHVSEEDVPTEAALTVLAEAPDVIGIGESGLDHVVAPAGTEARQAAGFRAHVAASRRTGLPLVVHARGADDAVAAILEDEHAQGAFPFVMHCFASGRALAERAVAIGGFVSFSGIVTFPRADALRDLARDLPEDRLLVETDAPFLSPAPFRGKRNEPGRVVHTADVLAVVRGVERRALDACTTVNFARAFRRAGV